MQKLQNCEMRDVPATLWSRLKSFLDIPYIDTLSRSALPVWVSVWVQ